MARPALLRRLGQIAPVLIVLTAAAAQPVRAADNLDVEVRGLLQREFRDLSRELGLAVSPYHVRPAESLGMILVVPHFEVGAEVTAVDINENRSYWRNAVDDADDLPGFLPVPKLHANVGLPLGLELGGLYSKVPESNVEFWGAEAKWAFVRGGVVWPALALRGAFSQLRGVDELDLETRSVDASISKGFGPVTPYAGAGRVWIDAEPKGVAAAAPVSLREESHTEDRLFAGVRLGLPFLSLTGEASFARVPAYTLRFNFSF
jgi:hypothetical protein